MAGRKVTGHLLPTRRRHAPRYIAALGRPVWRELHRHFSFHYSWLLDNYYIPWYLPKGTEAGRGRKKNWTLRAPLGIGRKGIGSARYPRPTPETRRISQRGPLRNEDSLITMVIFLSSGSPSHAVIDLGPYLGRYATSSTRHPLFLIHTCLHTTSGRRTDCGRDSVPVLRRPGRG